MNKKFNQAIKNDKSLLPKKKLTCSSPSLQKLPPPCLPPTRLFTDINQCYDAANDLRNLISSGDTTHKKTIRSLAKTIEKLKSEVESQIEQTETQADEDKLNLLLAANDILSQSLKKYKKYKRKQRKHRSRSGCIHEELKSNECPTDDTTEPIFMKRSRNLTSRDLKRCPTTPASHLSQRFPSSLPLKNEPKPKPVPSLPSSDSSMSGSDRDSPDLSNMSPISFAKKIECVRSIQDFEIEGLPSDDSLIRPVVYTSDKVKALQKKIEKLNLVTGNQEISMSTLRRRLQKKSDKVKELKGEKKELDAYISSLNAKFDKLKEDTVNVKTAEEHINALNNMIEDKGTKLDDCKNKIRNMEDYIEDMKQLVSSKQEAIDKNKQQIQEMQESIDSLHNKVETHEKQEEELKKKLSTKEQYILDIKDEVSAKTEFIKDLSVQLQASQDLIESLKAQITKLEESKLESEPNTPEIQDLSKSHLDFTTRYKQDDSASKSLDTTIIIPQIRPPFSHNIRENDRFSRFLEESKSQAITESGLKKIERKQTISPVTIIYGDDETISSQSDYSDHEMNEEDNEFYSTELHHRKPLNTHQIQCQDLVSKENVKFSNSRNPFKSAQMSSRSLIASLDFVENPQNYESSHLFRLCVNKRKGILYADSDIEVGVTSLTNGNTGSTMIYIGNKTDFPIQNLETKIYNINKPQVLKAAVDIVTDSSILANMTKIERMVSFEIKSEFSSSPQLLLKYVQNDAVVRHSIFLPITFALCLQSLEIEPELALAEYIKLRGYETLKRFQKLQNSTKSLREVAWFLHFSGNSRVFTIREIPEISSQSVLFCCKYHQDIIFYMITLEESAEGAELCIRSKNSKLRECLIPLLSKMISSEF